MSYDLLSQEGGVDRLGQERAEALSERVLPMLGDIVGRQRKRRHLRRHRARLLQQLEAVQAGQDEIGHEDIGRALFECPKGFLAGGDLLARWRRTR